jgi:non-specific serine/threonine protein kinase/serine/threonine-protein kinase
MTPQRFQQVREILHAALDVPEAQRSVYVSSAAQGDDDLKREVESLLAAAAAAGDFLDEPVLETDVQPESRIGAYRVTQQVGRGGMGTVYRAVRDDDQFQQEVAIKVVRRGMDTEHLLARFRYERQLLAYLMHPNIARLLDGGALPDGRPYLVLEYVSGTPITDYCHERSLSLDQRLRLFRKVCAAVEHAHRNLIVHRDLKPANILIDGDGEPKLLDFGIATLMLPTLGELETRQTRAGAMLTPEYASPEQVRGEPANTSTDVYSLGAILFEVLTGKRAQNFETLTPSEIERVVCMTDPPRPSDVVPELRKQLRGDLDNIVLKALNRDPLRRYSSVEQLSEDLRRHMEALPVIARPDSMLYRASKFVARHRVSVIATALLVFALAAGALATAWQARQARIERDRATRWFNSVRQLANSFLIEHDALAAIPGSTGLREKLVTDALRYLDSLAQEAGDVPEIQEELASAYERMGDVQGRADGPNLGNSAAALSAYRKSMAIREQLTQAAPSPRNRVALAANYVRLSGVLKVLGEYDAGLEYDRKALEIRESLSKAHPGDRELRRLLASSYTTLGGSLFQIGDWDGVLEARRRALQIAREIGKEGSASAEDQRTLALACVRMGSILVRNGDPDEALRHYQEALTVLAAAIKSFPRDARLRQTRATAYNAIGAAYLEKEDFARALSNYRAALEIRSELHAADADDFRIESMVAASHHRIGQALLRMNKVAEAEKELRTALEMRIKLSTRSPSNAGARGEVAETYAALGDAALAKRNSSSAREWYQRAHSLLAELERNRQANPDSLGQLKRVKEKLAEIRN